MWTLQTTTLLLLLAIVGALTSTTSASEVSLGRRRLAEDQFFCECECNGSDTAAVWIGETNADYDPDGEIGEDDDGVKYSWVCKTDSQVFNYLYDSKDVFCDNDCQDQDDDDVFVETDDDFYAKREDENKH